MSSFQHPPQPSSNRLLNRSYIRTPPSATTSIPQHVSSPTKHSLPPPLENPCWLEVLPVSPYRPSSLMHNRVPLLDTHPSTHTSKALVYLLSSPLRTTTHHPPPTSPYHQSPSPRTPPPPHKPTTNEGCLSSARQTQSESLAFPLLAPA